MLPDDVLEGARLLDAYAGTGAMGIEGLSHGAEWVDFVERDTHACKGIRDNLRDAGLKERAHVYCSTVKKALDYLSEPYDVVIMDPPYSEPGVPDIVQGLFDAGLLKRDGVVFVEHAWRDVMPEAVGELKLSKARRYGDTAVSVYREEASV